MGGWKFLTVAALVAVLVGVAPVASARSATSQDRPAVEVAGDDVTDVVAEAMPALSAGLVADATPAVSAGLVAAATPAAFTTAAEAAVSGRVAAGRTDCHRSTFRDPAGDARPLDITAYSAAFDCSIWGWVVQTPSAFALSAVGSFFVLIDADGNTSNGCSGFELAVGASRIDGELVGSVTANRTCSDVRRIGPAGAAHVGNRLAVATGHGFLGSPRSFRWVVALFPSAAGGVPDQGPNGDGPSVGHTAVVTGTQNPPPSSPGRPKVAVDAEGGVRMVWAEPLQGRPMADYLLLVRAVGKDWKVLPDPVSPTNRARIAAGVLPAGRDYEVAVAGINLVGRGAFSKPTRFTVAADPPTPTDPPSRPGRPKVAVRAGAMKAVWAAPVEGPVSDYVVIVRLGAGPWRVVDDGVSSENVAVIRGDWISSGRTINVAVAAVNDAGRGRFSRAAVVEVP